MAGRLNLFSLFAYHPALHLFRLAQGEAGVAGTSPDVVSPECNGRPVLQTHLSTIWSRRQQAVCVRHAFKHYGSSKNPNHVLENLNMTVAKGTMLGVTLPVSRLRWFIGTSLGGYRSSPGNPVRRPCWDHLGAKQAFG
uniref:(California timema) hypothetical protein n=1 Tax=Timema californicum TaxID=61474 RepID=A0A7R9J9H3_TIMCA|nr:unnamed protein product [Timema californicum]